MTREQILEWVTNNGPTWTALSKRVDVSPNALCSQWHRMARTPEAVKALATFKAKQSVPEVDTTPEAAFEQRTTAQALTDELNNLRGELTVAAREKNLKDALCDVARETAPKLPAAPPLWKPAKVSKGQVVETMFQLLSDLHAYESVSKERTRGHNEYNAEIMGRRVAQCVAGHLGIKRRMEKGGWTFPELVVGIGGDNVSGTIHDLERHADAPNIVLAVYGCAWLYAQAIREYAREYPKVYVFGVGGNHARLPGVKRKQMKDPTRTWDYMVYLLLREMLADQPNIQYWFPDSWGAQVNIRGWNFLLGHGDDIKSWAGIPWYGIQRRTSQLLALEGARGNVIHYQLFGHFHSSATIPNPAGETLINGSVVGGTEFSVDGLGVSDKPKQLMFGIHEDKGISHRWPLLLEPQDADIPQFTTTPWLDVQRRTDEQVKTWQIG